MYCDKCHKQSPDNFERCVYCGAPLAEKKPPKPSRFAKSRKRLQPAVLRKRALFFAAAAALIAVAAIVTAAFTSSKPETVVRNIVRATESGNEDLYFDTYCDAFVRYQTEKVYFDEARTKEALTKPLRESDAFYRDKCGDYRLSYHMLASRKVTDEELDAYRAYLREYCGFTKNPSAVTVVAFTVEAKGEKGSYTSEYRDFYCVRVGGRWYRSEKPTATVDAEIPTTEE